MSPRDISRRQFVAVSVAGAAAIVTRDVAAQEATPASSEEGGGIVSNAPGPTPTPLGPAEPPELSSSETNWAVENRDLKGTRHATGSQISSETVSELGTAWILPYDISSLFGALTANPIIVDDTLYIQDARSNVKALNRETGEVIWERAYDQDIPSGGPNGVAVGYGLVVFPVGGEGEVVAVDAATGEDVWSVNIQGPRGEGITMAPAIYDSTVYISTIPGNTSSFYTGGQRGFLHALDASTGRVLWYFDTTVDNLWGNARMNSGGGLWHPPSFDDEGNIYAGIGNAAPYPGNEQAPAGSSRPGDNDYANALMRINPETAGVDWYINIKPHDLFDLDNQLTPIVADVNVDGTDVPLVFSSGKHGIVVAANRETGEEVWRTPVGRHQNDELTDLPMDEPVEVLPGTFGGVETPMACADGVIYVPVFDLPTSYTATEIAGLADFSEAAGQLVALDAATGEVIWEVQLPTGTLAGATVVNDLVFTGGLDGVVRAHSIADGSQVWSYQTGAGINAPLAISGDYIYVASGGPLIPSPDTLDPLPIEGAALIAITIGGEPQMAGSASATPEEQKATPAASAGDGTSVSVSAVDIAFEPKSLAIAADTDVTITVTNEGVLQHDFVIENTEFATDLLNGGDSTELVVNLPAGEYTYFCSVPGHREAGMEGTLTVG